VYARELKAQSMPPEQWRSWDLSPIVGMTRSTVLAALGQPFDACPPANGIPCTFGVALVYNMYRLGPYDLGGGPHVALEFDQGGMCSEARWFITK
jgi:hypothetical protein